MRGGLVRALIVLIAVVGSTGEALAARGVYAITIDNDVLASADREYTAGLKLAYLSPEGEGRALARRLLRARDDEATRIGFAVGQSIFTPQDTQSTAPLVGERPYAGWLYGELSVYAARRGGAHDVLTATVGVIGPAALADEAQNTFHRIFGFREILGWDNQLPNEPAVMLSFDRVWRIGAPGRGFGIDARPTLGASVGVPLTEARAGLRVRIGDDLPAAIGNARVQPTGFPSETGLSAAADGFSWRLFGGVAGRAVGRNQFLDGALFRDSLSVDSRAFVRDFETGGVVTLGGLELSFAYVWRGREYETQSAPHRFASLTLGAQF